MSAYMYDTATRRLVLFITTSLCIVLALGKEKAVLVKRDTTLDNVKAMYNRFVSESTGKAKYTDVGKNACSMDLPPSVTNTPGILHVAASKDDFQASLGCGTCITIHGSGKPAAADLDGSPPVKGTLKGIIVDQDDSLNQGDLALLPPQSGSGLWEINFKATDCPTALGPTGYIQLRFTGSNEMYFKLQAMNTKVPVAGIEAFERVKGKWFCLTRTPNNFFSSEGMGAVSFPLKVRLTSIMNEHLEATIEALKNDVVINSDIQFSDTKVRGGSPEGIQCYGQGDRPPSGEGDVGFCVSKEDGIYADPADDTAFYVCEGEKATKKFCPTGLKFNPVISGCDIAEDVKYVEHEGDLSGTSSSKEDSRWTSLPGNEGLKVLSVGGRQEPQKDDSKTDLKEPPPRKLFSINIFNSAYSQKTNKLHEERLHPDAVNNGRFQENVQNMSENVTNMGSITKENYRKPESASADVALNVQERLRNDQNRKISETPSIFMAQRTESANNNNLSQGTGRLEDNHHGERIFISEVSTSPTAELNPKISLRPASNSFSSARPENSDNRKFQAEQDVGNANSLQSHPGQPPHRLLAINIYGSHPQVPQNENQMYTSDQNRLSGVKEFELADQSRDSSSSNNGHRVLAGALGSQNDHGEALNTPELKSVATQENKPYANIGTKTGEENLFSTNDSTAIAPLHFKLKVNMDNSGKQPVINCTLSECSENDFAIEDYKIAGKSSESKQKNESNEGEHHDNHGSQMTNESSDLQVTLTTDSSEPVTEPQVMKGIRGSPNQLIRPLITFSHTQSIHNKSPQLEDISQTTAQSSHSSLTKQAQENVFSSHRNGTTAQTASESPSGNRIKTKGTDVGIKVENVQEHSESSKETQRTPNLQEKMLYENREENRMSTQNNRETTKGVKVIQHGERDSEVKASNLQPSLGGESSVSNSSMVDEHNARKLENANQNPSKENNFHADEGHVEQMENFFNNKLKTGLQGNSLTNQLVNNKIKTQFHEQGQLNSQDFVQIQSHPQLKIILKNPGKIINPLKRRSDAKGHIVQILKSLIDRPLRLGSKNKEVASMLSTLVNKQVQAQKREKTPQDDSEAIKDSGSIAESILEANKEYLDAIAMQGMVFSDGDPETENMTNVVDSYQGRVYQQQELKDPQTGNPYKEGKNPSTGFHEKSSHNGALQEDWLNDENLVTRIKDSGGGGDSASGMGDKDSGSGKPGKDEGSGGLKVDAQKDHFNDADRLFVTVGHYGASEVNTYKGGMLKSKSDPIMDQCFEQFSMECRKINQAITLVVVSPRFENVLVVQLHGLKSFCIGKSSGIYTNPFERKSFVICFNGVSEERECPAAMLFNPKEKMCDVPDNKEEEQSKKNEKITTNNSLG